MPANNHTRPLTTAFLIASLIIPGPLTGCASTNLYKPQRAKTQREAGSVHVAVLSVHTWRSMVDKLQPHFQLTEEEARLAVIRDSRRTDEKSTNQFGAKAGYTNNDGTTPPIDPSTGLPIPGGVGPPVIPTYPYEGRSPSERPDANLEFNAAKDLFQEVQMINSYVKDAVIPPGHRAYVVRLQVTLMPGRRHSPYDVEARIGFFSPDSEYAADSSPGATGAGPDAPPATDVRMRGEDGELLVAMDEGPTVLPLFATDNLEASFNARSAEDMLSLSAAFGDATGGISKAIGFDAFSSAAQAQVYGRDLNALLTVGKLGPNCLIVRMGAMQETTADHAMVPRNHHITVLVTVPEDSPAEIDVTLVTELKDTETGKVLRGTTNAEIQELYQEILDDYDIDESTNLIVSLRSAAQRNRHREFLDILVRAVGPDHSAVSQRDALWVDLANLTAGSKYAGTEFILPGHGELAAEMSENFFLQTPILKDDGFASSEVTLKGIKLVQNVEPEAMLTIETDGAPVNLPGRWIKPLDGDEDRRELTFQFDSPAMLGLIRDDGTVGPISLILTLKQDETYPFQDLLYMAAGGIPN